MTFSTATPVNSNISEQQAARSVFPGYWEMESALSKQNPAMPLKRDSLSLGKDADPTFPF
jgi:hypothetical protein